MENGDFRCGFPPSPKRRRDKPGVLKGLSAAGNGEKLDATPPRPSRQFRRWGKLAGRGSSEQTSGLSWRSESSAVTEFRIFKGLIWSDLTTWRRDGIRQLWARDREGMRDASLRFRAGRPQQQAGGLGHPIHKPRFQVESGVAPRTPCLPPQSMQVSGSPGVFSVFIHSLI